MTQTLLHTTRQQRKALGMTLASTSWCAALVVVLGALALLDPVGRCAILHCGSITRLDALAGFATRRVGDPEAGLTRQDVQSISYLRTAYNHLLWVSMTVLNHPLKGTTMYQDEAKGTSENGYHPVKVLVITSKQQSSSKAAKRLRPVIFFTHGGGMVIGEANDPVAHLLAHYTDAIVISPEYRLAPESNLGVEDCYAALLWAVNRHEALGIDLDRVGVAGVSAGGLITAALAILARDRWGPRLKAQLLWMPMLTPDVLASRLEFWDDHGILSSRRIAWFWEMYIGEMGVEACRKAVWCSPLNALEKAKGLPDTTVVVAARDILRSEGLMYAAKLNSSRVTTTVLECRGSHVAIAFEDCVERTAKAFWAKLQQ